MLLGWLEREKKGHRPEGRRRSREQGLNHRCSPFGQTSKRTASEGDISSPNDELKELRRRGDEGFGWVLGSNRCHPGPAGRSC